MQNKYRQTPITVLLSVGLFFALNLVFKEITIGNQCPKIGIIPACFFVVLFFLIPLVVHILRKGNIFFFIFTGIGLALGIFASLGQLTGKVQCPTLMEVIPTCFIAFTLFSISIILKLILIRKNQNNQV